MVVVPYDQQLFVQDHLLPAHLRAAAVKPLDDESRIALRRFVDVWSQRARGVWCTCDGELASAAMIRAVVELATLTLYHKPS